MFSQPWDRKTSNFETMNRITNPRIIIELFFIIIRMCAHVCLVCSFLSRMIHRPRRLFGRLLDVTGVLSLSSENFFFVSFLGTSPSDSLFMPIEVPGRWSMGFGSTFRPPSCLVCNSKECNLPNPHMLNTNDSVLGFLIWNHVK